MLSCHTETISGPSQCPHSESQTLPMSLLGLTLGLSLSCQISTALTSMELQNIKILYNLRLSEQLTLSPSKTWLLI